MGCPVSRREPGGLDPVRSGRRPVPEEDLGEGQPLEGREHVAQRAGGPGERDRPGVESERRLVVADVVGGARPPGEQHALLEVGGSLDGVPKRFEGRREIAAEVVAAADEQVGEEPLHGCRTAGQRGGDPADLNTGVGMVGESGCLRRHHQQLQRPARVGGLHVSGSLEQYLLGRPGGARHQLDRAPDQGDVGQQQRLLGHGPGGVEQAESAPVMAGQARLLRGPPPSSSPELDGSRQLGGSLESGRCGSRRTTCRGSLRHLLELVGRGGVRPRSSSCAVPGATVELSMVGQGVGERSVGRPPFQGRRGVVDGGPDQGVSEVQPPATDLHQAGGLRRAERIGVTTQRQPLPAGWRTARRTPQRPQPAGTSARGQGVVVLDRGRRAPRLRSPAGSSAGVPRRKALPR